MIKKIKPCQAEALIKVRRPIGLFYARQDGIYIGIDNSTGHAWVEELKNLHQCKEWLRSPYMQANGAC